MDKTQKRRLCHLTSVMLCSLLEFLTLEKVGLIGCPEMSGRNGDSTLCNISEDRRSDMTI